MKGKRRKTKEGYKRSAKNTNIEINQRHLLGNLLGQKPRTIYTFFQFEEKRKFPQTQIS